MKSIYLLDTDIILEIVNPNPDENLCAKMESRGHNCAISAITWAELLSGVKILPPGEKQSKLEDFLYNYVQEVFPILPYDSFAASVNADINSKLKSLGLLPSILDTQIASIAISNNLILVTRNKKNYEPISQNFSLALEDWSE